MPGLVGVEPLGAEFLQAAGDEALAARDAADQADDARQRMGRCRTVVAHRVVGRVADAERPVYSSVCVSDQLRPTFTSTPSGTLSFMTPDISVLTRSASASRSSAGVSNNS